MNLNRMDSEAELEKSSSDSLTFASLFPRNNASSKNEHCYSMVVSPTPQPAFSPQECFHAILKISNISWDTSTTDIIEFLAAASPIIKEHQIHIPIDRLTGKTRSDMYIEMSNIEDILKIMHQMNRRILKGRSLCMNLASFDELYKVHFNVYDDLSGLGISKTEATSLINICRNYKIYFSRKCAERPFEHIISLLRLTEWWRLRPSGRDRLFQIAVTSLEALHGHLTRPYCQINSILFQRLVDIIKTFPAFTPGQQAQIEKFLVENKVGMLDHQDGDMSFEDEYSIMDNTCSLFADLFKNNHD